MSPTVHHLNESRSQRVLFLLEELEIPYDIKFYQRNPKTMLAPAALKAIHPLGKSPIVTDGEDTLAESGLIIDTLIDRYGAGTTLRPAAGSPDRLRYGYYLHYAEGSLMPMVLISLLLSSMSTRSPRLLRPLGRLMTGGVMSAYVTPNTNTQLDFLESELAGRPWFAGQHLTGADAIMSYPLQAIQSRGQLGQRPRLADWISRIQARPAWARAIAKGGPLTFKLG